MPPYPTTSQPFGVPGMMMRDPTQGTAGLMGQMNSVNANVKGRRTGQFETPVGPLLQAMLPGQYQNLPGQMGLNQASLLTRLAWDMAQTWEPGKPPPQMRSY